MTNTRTKAFVTAVVIGGAAALIANRWEVRSAPLFTAYLALAIAGAMMKVRLPNMMGTFSLHFFFVLLALLDLGPGAALAVGGVSVIVQCCWRPAVRPRAIQVLFNVGNMLISIAAASYGSPLVTHVGAVPRPAVILLVSATLFFITNISLVSIVLSLNDGKSLVTVWQHWFLWSFPYYVIGAAVAAVLSTWTRFGERSVLILLFPVMYLVYRYYRLYVDLHRPAEAVK